MASSLYIQWYSRVCTFKSFESASRERERKMSTSIQKCLSYSSSLASSYFFFSFSFSVYSYFSCFFYFYFYDSSSLTRQGCLADGSRLGEMATKHVRQPGHMEDLTTDLPHYVCGRAVKLVFWLLASQSASQPIKMIYGLTKPTDHLVPHVLLSSMIQCSLRSSNTWLFDSMHPIYHSLSLLFFFFS